MIQLSVPHDLFGSHQAGGTCGSRAWDFFSDPLMNVFIQSRELCMVQWLVYSMSHDTFAPSETAENPKCMLVVQLPGTMFT